MNLQATKEADCYMHIYFNVFKQRIVLRRGYKARKNRTELIKLVGIVLVLGLYWCWDCIGIADFGCCIVLVLVLVGKSLYCSSVLGIIPETSVPCIMILRNVE
jgi:hypothetical protein